MKVSERLKDEIIRSKQTRYAIAVGAGIDHAVLRRFLSGERDIKLHTAERLAGYLGLSLRKGRK